MNKLVNIKSTRVVTKKGKLNNLSKSEERVPSLSDKYNEFKDIKLKQYYLSWINFSRNSKYYISPSKWYKLPKSTQKAIRNKEKKYGNNYELAVKKDPKLRKLYKKIGIK